MITTHKNRLNNLILSTTCLFFSVFSFADYSDYIYTNSEPSYNSLGQTGLIMTPSAHIKTGPSIYLTSSRNNIWKIGTLTATPFDWLEAGYYYYRPSDIAWAGQKGLYLDKGFNVKFSFTPKRLNNRVTFAAGLDDFAGTGIFAKEYLVSTFNFQNARLNLGVGFGMFAGEDSLTFSNPLSKIAPSFEKRLNIDEYRDDDRYGQGGTPTTDAWFKGDATFFGGLEYFIPYKKGIKVKIELDTFDYFDFTVPGPGKDLPSRNSIRWKDSKINYGISYPFKYGNIDLSYIKGNTLNISLSLGLGMKNNIVKKKPFTPTISPNINNSENELTFYRDLLSNLARNQIYMQSADISENNLSISIETDKFRNPVVSSSRAAYIAKSISDFDNFNFDYINVSTISMGSQINEMSFKEKNLLLHEQNYPLSLVIRETDIINPKPNSYKAHKYQPLVNFPIIFNTFKPEIRSHIGSPQKFYYGGISLILNSEIQFNRNLVLSSKIGTSLIDNFGEKASQPASNLPHVRTEVVDYLNGSKTYIEKLKLDYIWSPRKNVYTKLSSGIFETMYGGFGGELLYKPFNSDIYIGYDFYKVKRREFDQKFKFKDYEVQTDHINLGYYHTRSNILIKTSYGNYLAGDKGYTLDLSRRTASGVSIGFFFSRTNVPFDLFGEGSFDKGFYFNIPNDVFSSSYSKLFTGFGLKTLFRDGGQVFNIDNSLIDFFHKTSRTEITEGWYEYLH